MTGAESVQLEDVLSVKCDKVMEKFEVIVTLVDNSVFTVCGSICQT